MRRELRFTCTEDDDTQLFEKYAKIDSYILAIDLIRELAYLANRATKYDDDGEWCTCRWIHEINNIIYNRCQLVDDQWLENDFPGCARDCKAAKKGIKDGEETKAGTLQVP